MAVDLKSGEIKGQIKTKIRITGAITPSASLTGHVALPTGFESYNGSYNAIPTIDKQIMNTKNKMMTNDFVIEGIPFYEVSNAEGGETFIIGGNS